MRPRERFSDRAGDYVAGRPSYPSAALDALFEGLGDPAEVVAVDLGAGTGISSRLLAARGAQVFAVEPNAAMRDAAEADPRVVWVDATAENTGLEEACADLVVAFQAFHWFEPAATLREMLRLLRPGGRVAIVSNERDESDPFTAAYGDAVRRYRTDDTEQVREDGRAVFARFEAWHRLSHLAFPHEQALDRERLHARVRSTSYLPKDGPSAEALHRELDALADRFGRNGMVALRLQTLLAIGESGADGA